MTYNTSVVKKKNLPGSESLLSSELLNSSKAIDGKLNQVQAAIKLLGSKVSVPFWSSNSAESVDR